MHNCHTESSSICRKCSLLISSGGKLLMFSVISFSMVCLNSQGKKGLEEAFISVLIRETLSALFRHLAPAADGHIGLSCI